MKRSFWTHHVELAAACAAAVIVGACGGSSGGSGTQPPTPTTLTGVAAVGAPLAGATVTVIDASTTTTNPAAVTTAANGTYTVDVSGLQAPLTIQVVGTAAGVPQTLVSVLLTLTPNASNTGNVTPLTHAVAALIAPGSDPAALLNPATLASAATSTNVGNAVTALTTTLASDASIAARLGTGFNPMTTSFAADGSGIDAVLEQLTVGVSSQGVQITNLAAPVTDQGAPAPVLLTAAVVVNPASAPALPASAASSDVPAAADIEFYRAKLQACLALPLAQRVTFAANGIDVTTVSPTCNFGDPGFRSSGRSWVEQLGQFTFSKAQYSNASFGKGAIVLALAPQNLTDPKEFKHPQCNSGPCAVVRYPATYTGGFVETWGWDFLFGKVGGQWALVGNQRPYDVFIQTRLNRYVAANTAPNTTNNYFFKDRIESNLRLFFNASGRNGDLVRAVRFKGPGLPPTGVVLHRSSRCGTDDRFPITYQNGSLRTPSGGLVTFNNGGGVEFTVDAANLDGTPLTMPAPVFSPTLVTNQNFSPTPVSNIATLAPAWTRYAVEIFLFSNTTTPDEPDEIIYTRIDSPAASAAEGATRAWPTLSPTFVDAFLKPAGSGAGAVTGPLTMAWTAPQGLTVLSSYLFAQNFVTQLNANNFSSLYGKRTRLDFEPVTYGDLSAPSTLFAKVGSSASLAPQTANLAPNPNPRCTDNTALVPFLGDANDYREVGLGSRPEGKQRQTAIWFWDN